MEADAVYLGHAFDYVDTANDPIARALFICAENEVSLLAEVDDSLATGSLRSDNALQALLAATGQPQKLTCWTPAEVREHMAAAGWPEVELLDDDSRRDVLTAQCFLGACAAGGYGIQFS